MRDELSTSSISSDNVTALLLRNSGSFLPATTSALRDWYNLIASDFRPTFSLCRFPAAQYELTKYRSLLDF